MYDLSHNCAAFWQSNVWLTYRIMELDIGNLNMHYVILFLVISKYNLITIIYDVKELDFKSYDQNSVPCFDSERDYPCLTYFLMRLTIDSYFIMTILILMETRVSSVFHRVIKLVTGLKAILVSDPAPVDSFSAARKPNDTNVNDESVSTDSSERSGESDGENDSDARRTTDSKSHSTSTGEKRSKDAGHDLGTSAGVRRFCRRSNRSKKNTIVKRAVATGGIVITSYCHRN